MPADLHYLSLDEVAKRLKARKLRSTEVTEAILDRIDKLDPKLKAFATITREQALAEAKARDAETPQGARRPSASSG
jgi:Asp-tRNA(Asn)/Glu-tRNA(Gln) amidotransferase A subunit family amidase